MTDAAVDTGRVVARRYVVGRLLGSGAMGTVRAAFDLDLDKEVAIKFVSSEELPEQETVERFRREVHVAARLKSEHAVRVLDVGSLPNGTPFMVMELLEGHGLDAERDQRGVMPVDEAVGYILPAIEVLAEAHAAGVVHRDLKPANLFLEARPDAPRFVKVLDFGVSKSSIELTSPESSITRTGMIVGSPLYMAPEQLRSTRSADTRADIWSLGAILFELVTGFTAHEGETVAEICATLLRDPPRSIRDFGSELPPGFAEVVMRCLEPDPERRYANVADLGEALLPFAPDCAIHVERARRVLALGVSESRDSGERVPSSDSPVTLDVDHAIEKSGRREIPDRKNAALAGDETGELSGFTFARAALAFLLVGLGIGTAFLIEFPRHAPRHAAEVPVAPVPSVTIAPSHPVAVPAPEPTPPLATSTPSAAASIAPNPSSAPPRKWYPKRRPAIARPRTPAGAEVTDFGGRR